MLRRALRRGLSAHATGRALILAFLATATLSMGRPAAAESVFIGDIYEIDVRGARSAGIAPILIDPLLCYGDVDCARIAGLSGLLDLLPARAAGRRSTAR